MGKAVLFCAGRIFPLPDSAAIELPSNVRGASYLYLLHAAGWTKPHSRLGSVEITYPGQLRQREDLTVDIDAGNWWNPENLPNGTVVWRDHNDHAALGLYLTCIKLDRPDPVKILFRHGEGSLWMLVAASLADGAIRRPRPDEALFIVAGEKYVPIDAFKPIKAGTVLDLSSHTEKPAGKFGHIIATGNGHLAFEKAPGKRIRMFGTNLCGSACFPPRRYAPKLADELARMGYNSVRLHHIERELAEKGGKSSLEFSREKLDRLDWFVHCLKERGLYITIDLFSYRALRPGELPSVSAQSNSTYGFKALLPFEEAVYQNWCDYVQNLLDHVNPYTGLRWADDPVLFCVNLVNEDSLPGLWRRAARNLFRKRYETYLEQRGIRTPENLNAVTGPYYEFLHELQARVIERLKHFVRTELKSKVLITDLNWYTVPYLSLMRGKLLDLVDNHQYTAHPSFPRQTLAAADQGFPGQFPLAIRQQPASDDADQNFREAVYLHGISVLQPEYFTHRGRSIDGSISCPSGLGRAVSFCLVAWSTGLFTTSPTFQLRLQSISGTKTRGVSGLLPIPPRRRRSCAGRCRLSC